MDGPQTQTRQRVIEQASLCCDSGPPRAPSTDKHRVCPAGQAPGAGTPRGTQVWPLTGVHMELGGHMLWSPLPCPLPAPSREVFRVSGTQFPHL